MLTVILIFAAIYLAGLCVLAGAAWRAPEGFEDEQGFHKGRNAGSPLQDDGAL